MCLRYLLQSVYHRSSLPLVSNQLGRVTAPVRAAGHSSVRGLAGKMFANCRVVQTRELQQQPADTTWTIGTLTAAHWRPVYQPPPPSLVSRLLQPAILPVLFKYF